MIVDLKNVRLSFPHLIEPRPDTFGNSAPRWTASFLINPESEEWEKVEKAIKQKAKETWEDKSEAILKSLKTKSNQRFWGDGDEKLNKQGEPYDGYVGVKYVTTSKTAKVGTIPPQIIDKQAKVVDPNNQVAYVEAAKELYAGCYVNAVIKIWAHKGNESNKWSDGIKAELLALQFAADGERFGGNSDPDVSSMFAPVKKELPAFLG